ncbi:MAG: hypothetical protein LBM13_05420, partial [Candidatus Ancillula sp.]|nr:hypothetical protein [Candidatus Ancillula sp.]
ELSGIENLEIPEFTTDGLEYNYRNKFTYELTEDHNSYAVLERSSHNLLPIEKSSLPREEISERALEILNLGIEDNLDKIVIRVNSNGKTVATGDQDIILSDYLLGQKFVYDLNSFFQINLPVYSLFLRDLQDFVLDLNFKDDLELVDFYSGVGTIGLTLAAGELKDKFKRISLVEVSKSSVKYAKKNCRNILGKYSERAEVVLANANRALGYIKKNSLLIVDPPRAGLDKKVRRQICDVKPKYIAYLSCNPATQARDVRQLLENGYQILQTQGYNFFPRTPHIENLVILEAE